MFDMRSRLPRRAGLGVLAGACLSFAAVAVAAGAATPSASAGSRGQLSMLDLPPAEVEPRAAARVIAEAPLWKSVQLTCNASICVGRLPPVPTSERWDIRFVSCSADTAVDATLRHFSLQVTNGKITRLLGHHFVAPTFQSIRGQAAVYTASQPMVLRAQAGNVLHATASAVGNAGNAECSVTGVRQKLE